MTTADKALLTKELNKASAALQQAFRLARYKGNFDLARSLERQQKTLADEIIKLNGGPVKLKAVDLLSN